jgi:glycosyltransferase involved in cell wall biosynthesis
MTGPIVQIIPKPDELGGAGRVADLERVYLDGIGREVSVMGVGNGGLYEVSPLLAQRAGRRAGRVARHVGDLADPGSRFSAHRAFKAAPPSLVHVHIFQGISLDVIRAIPPTIPIVWTLHDYGALCPRNSLTNRDGTPCSGHRICDLRRRIVEGTLRARAITFISPSQHLLDEHIALFGWMRDQSVVLRNPVEAPRVSVTPRRTSPEALRVGFLGKRTFEKGYDRMLELAARDRSVQLVVAGPTADFKEPIQPIDDLGLVEPRDLDARFWSQIDVLAVPSRWPENAPMVVAEALIRGVPVLASQCGGIPEMVHTEHGRSGVLLKDWSPESVADALTVLRRPSFREAAATAATAARITYDPDEHGRLLVDLFDELMST